MLCPMETDWSGLPLDLLAAIFAKLRVYDVLSGAGLVCRSWLDAAKLPTLWRSVRMALVPIGRFDEGDLCSMAMAAVDRAAGRLEAFSGAHFVSDALLRYIAERSPSLTSLTVICCAGVTNKGLAAVADGCPRLQHLHVVLCYRVDHYDAALQQKVCITRIQFVDDD